MNYAHAQECIEGPSISLIYKLKSDFCQLISLSSAGEVKSSIDG